MPVQNKHPCNKGKIPSDKVGSRGYDGEWCRRREEYRSREEKWYLQSYKLCRGIVADVLLAQVERLEDEDTTFGDEMNALTDYYFGLAVDRPESPPL
jgi:hypothetical protein